MKNKNCLWKLNKDNLNMLFETDYVEDTFSAENILNKDSLLKLGLNQGILYNYDSVTTANIEGLDIDSENIIEAAFFNEKAEIRFVKDDDTIKGYIFFESKEISEYIEEEYILYNRYKEKEYAKRLTARKYITYDEDMQAYICYTKPCKLIFGGEADET